VVCKETATAPTNDLVRLESPVRPPELTLFTRECGRPASALTMAFAIGHGGVSLGDAFVCPPSSHCMAGA